MKPMLKVSAAVLIAAMSVAPALAAIDSASLVVGTKANVVPAMTLDGVIGKWTPQQLTALNGASTVTVFDTKLLYDTTQLKLVSANQTKMMADITQIHQAIDNDAALKAWFVKNKVDVDRVIAVTDTGGKVDVYLY
ncbi:MAG: hypothetical protein ABL879_07180 [Devosia sp.]